MGIPERQVGFDVVRYAELFPDHPILFLLIPNRLFQQLAFFLVQKVEDRALRHNDRDGQQRGERYADRMERVVIPPEADGNNESENDHDRNVESDQKDPEYLFLPFFHRRPRFL